MEQKVLYCFKRDGGCTTMSTIKPECEYREQIRLIASEGKQITKDGVVFHTIVDVDSADGWYEVDAPPEEEGGDGVIIA